MKQFLSMRCPQGIRAMSMLLLGSTTVGAQQAGATESEHPSGLTPREVHVSAGDDANAPVLDQAERIAEAKQRFDRGLALYRDNDPALALIEFSRAYQLVPNYRVLYNIGQVSIQLGKYANARRSFESYLQQAGDSLPAERRGEVEADLIMLAGRTAYLSIESEVTGAEVLVDDISMGTTPMAEPLLVDAGVHRVELRLAGHIGHASRVTLAGGDRVEVAPSIVAQVAPAPVFVVEKPTDASEANSNWLAVGWAATGALTAGAVVTGIMALGEKSEHDELVDARPEQVANLRLRLNEAEANGRGLFLASDVMALSALLVGGTALWFTLAQDDEKSDGVSDVGFLEEHQVAVGYSKGQLRLRGAF